MYFDDAFAFLLGGFVTWAFVAIYWTLLWRKAVQWTARRRLGPIVVAAFGVLMVVIARLSLLNSGLPVGKWIVLSILVPALWLIATVYFWQETPAERASRISDSGRADIPCPKCGYNLRGLMEARCPECGTRFTLDELLAAQSSQIVGEIG